MGFWSTDKDDKKMKRKEFNELMLQVDNADMFDSIQKVYNLVSEALLTSDIDEKTRELFEEVIDHLWEFVDVGDAT